MPPSTTEEGRNQRAIRWENIITEEFDMMMYIPGMSYSDLENMPRFERKKIYEKLKNYLEDMKKNH